MSYYCCWYSWNPTIPRIQQNNLKCNLTTMKIWKGILFWNTSFLPEWIEIGWSDWINWNALPLPIERQTLWPPNISNFTNIAPKKILHYREIHLDGVTITLNQTFQTVPSRTPKKTHSTRWNTIEQIFLTIWHLHRLYKVLAQGGRLRWVIKR